MLQGRYQFFMLKPSLSDDTHGLLVVPHKSARLWPEVPDHLVLLDLGYDYFNGVRVPYLNHGSSAPGLITEQERIASSKDALGSFVQALFGGKMDADAAAQLAKLAMMAPGDSEAAAGKTEAEIAAEIQREFNAVLASPKVAENLRQLDQAMGDLKSLINAPRKP